MKKVLVANWKENPETEREALDLFGATVHAAKGKKVTVAICPPFVYLEKIGERMSKSKNKSDPALGAQDIFWEERGPHTGEIGPKMLKQFGVRYVIVGHSERRWLGETDEMVNQKVFRSLKSGLRVILCVGESALVRRRGLPAAKQFVASQLRKDLKELVARRSPIPSKVLETLAAHLLIAYEPIWAIGTGRNDPPDDARAMAIFIKKTVARILHAKFTPQTAPFVLYGGSVDSRNIQDYIQCGEIDGALVGGASLKARGFKTMIDVVNDLDKNKK